MIVIKMEKWMKMHLTGWLLVQQKIQFWNEEVIMMLRKKAFKLEIEGDAKIKIIIIIFHF